MDTDEEYEVEKEIEKETLGDVAQAEESKEGQTEEQSASGGPEYNYEDESREYKEEKEERLFEKEPAKEKEHKYEEKKPARPPDIAELELSVKAIAEYVKKQIAAIKAKSVTRQDIKEEFDKLGSEIREKSVTMEDVTEEIGKLRRNVLPHVERLDSEIDKLRKEVKEETRESSKYDMNLERRVEKIEDQIEHVQRMKEKHGELEKKVHEIHTTIGGHALRSDKVVDAHLKRVAELEKKLEDMGRVMSKGTTGVVLKKLKTEVDGQLEEIKKEVDAKMRYVDRQLVETKPSHHAPGAEGDEIAVLRAEIERLRGDVGRIEAGPEIKDAAMNLALENMKDAKTSEGYRDLIEDVHDLRKAMDEESALRVSFDKKLAGLMSEMKRLQDSMRNMKQFENIDYKKIMAAYEGERKIEADIHKRIEAETAKVAVKYMNEFVKTLDRKMPQLATKNEVARLEAKMESRFGKKPLITAGMPADKRIEFLEKRVNELVESLRGFKSPFVID